MTLEAQINIDFAPEEHAYRVDGRKVSSVTSILKSEGFIDTRWYKPSGTSRGEMVHQGTEAIDRGHLTIAQFPPSEIIPYLKAWQSFKADIGVSEFVIIELPIGSKVMEYGGIPDRVAVINGEYWLLDIKSGAHELWHGHQLAAYKIALEETFGLKVAKRRVVHLKKTGKYSICGEDKKIGSFDLPVWEQQWIAIATARLIKQRYAKIKPETV
ncbi:PD-(D/E)XK nuclease family protein [Sediminispirochaeta smaragdinae]|uniref:PD-(D/E)XK endonuclease-like domain-containing protein n=1 Tax=Sediminispirochaeta smaragdinae (strain DSM 11293 / JCM 15392 / SEBR 4228) TaxID=573413 RepID=E1R207_SEDSS|nr:PD-(D/E)XK nuclease family protein [Sediminispirochaeta smaragdinae]ADK81892.1 hypothetical protein Spirs_2789 [Sediminispirochaeta smaragdinae DSM 11293]